MIKPKFLTFFKDKMPFSKHQKARKMIKPFFGIPLSIL